jgi:hypothetical protein
MNMIFGSRNGSGSVGCTGEGDHKGFLTLNQHLLDPTAAPGGLGSLSGLGRSPLQNTGFRRGNLYGCPRSEDTSHQDHA